MVWDHYFVLLVIPCALAWPRMSPAWVLLMGGWMLVATNQDSPSLAGAIAYDLMAAAMFAMSVRAMSLKRNRAAVRGSSPHHRASTPTPGAELNDETPEDVSFLVRRPTD